MKILLALSWSNTINAKGQFDDELPDGETSAMQLTASGVGNQDTVGVE